MTRETAVEIRELLDKGGEIDEYGFIRGCCVWTPTIEEMIKKGAGIFFNGAAGKMQIDNWPVIELEEPEEPEWKQKVREILGPRHIDEKGYIEGMVWTDDVRRILKAGGYFMVDSSGKACISNWRENE